MANIEEEKFVPKVSRLPLPITDSPLVIDLPDGQKIVVGKMTEGSVIEVATWRGVGRPDSRTSRLMLGVGNGDVNEADEDDESGKSKKAAPKPKGFAGVIFTLKNFFLNFKSINWSLTIKTLFAALTSKGPKKSKRSKAPAQNGVANEDLSSRQSTDSSTLSTLKAVPVSEDSEIEAWLNQISEKASGASTKSGKSATKKAVAKKSAVKKSVTAKAPVKKSLAKKASAKKASPVKEAAAKSTKKR